MDGWAVVCDFDATTTMQDVGDEVVIRFAGADLYRRECDAYRDGAIDFGTLLLRLFEPIRASRDEIASYAREIAVLRPGFERLVATCRDAGRPFVLCSSGFDVYIEPVLAARVPDELRAHIALRVNRAIPGPEGLTIHFHSAGEGCGRCGSCKEPAVRELQRAGHRVAFIGDGASDRCGAAAADRVFARASLLRHCRDRGISAEPFDTFDEILAAW
jgi:2-hydroxy-3-keto-5-methylthiopentenyl-1-phosphate phosphatase